LPEAIRVPKLRAESLPDNEDVMHARMTAPSSVHKGQLYPIPEGINLFPKNRDYPSRFL
jgi:hypothetical protein